MRKTLGRSISVPGIGLFTEQDVTCTLVPATENGVYFEIGEHRIAATIDSLCTTPIHPLFAQLPPRNTNLGSGAPAIITTEHVLSALFALNITNLIVKLDAPELPIGNGSADHFVDAILQAGTVEIPGGPPTAALTETITVDDGRGGVITAQPADTLSFAYELDYGPNAPIPPQRAEWSRGDRHNYVNHIGLARTFSLAEEAAAMQAAGLFSRFTPRDLLVIGPDGPVENELRFDNEPAAHKLLDVVGDLALIARPFTAKITATRSGHALNHALARRIADHIG